MTYDPPQSPGGPGYFPAQAPQPPAKTSNGPIIGVSVLGGALVIGFCLLLAIFGSNDGAQPDTAAQPAAMATFYD